MYSNSVCEPLATPARPCVSLSSLCVPVVTGLGKWPRRGKAAKAAQRSEVDLQAARIRGRVVAAAAVAAAARSGKYWTGDWDLGADRTRRSR